MNSTQLIFLSYINRSGSTYLAELMSVHADICVCPEAEVLIRDLLRENSEEKFVVSEAIAKLMNAVSKDLKLSAWGVDWDKMNSSLEQSENRFDLFYRFLIGYRDQVKPQAKKIVFKGTELLKLSPEYRGKRIPCIVITRDGRAAYASQKKSKGSLSGMPMQVSPVVAATEWRTFTEMALSNKEILHVKYEDLVLNNDEVMHKVWSYLSIQAPDNSEQSGDLTSRIPENQKHLHVNIGKGPIQSRIDSWKKELSPVEINLFELNAGETLDKMDYPLLKPRLSRSLLLINSSYFFLKNKINLLLNKVIYHIKK